MAHAELTMHDVQGSVAEERPFGFRTKKLVMWLFIIADASTFGAILFAYGYVRVGSPDWVRPFAFFPTILNGHPPYQQSDDAWRSPGGDRGPGQRDAVVSCDDAPRGRVRRSSSPRMVLHVRRRVEPES